jgi:hypothetical protein
MERCSVDHRIAAVEMFITTESVTVTLRGFRQEFQRRDAPVAILCYCGYQNGVKKEQ